jgi:hypothetical protein
LTTILAQSSQFAITQSNTTSTTAPSNAVYVFFSSLGAHHRPLRLSHCLPLLFSTSASNPSQTDSAGDLNPTDSATNTTGSSKNGADRITAAGSTGLIFAALAAFFL